MSRESYARSPTYQVKADQRILEGVEPAAHLAVGRVQVAWWHKTVGPERIRLGYAP
jgi:hypothetical protein